MVRVDRGGVPSGDPGRDRGAGGGRSNLTSPSSLLLKSSSNERDDDEEAAVDAVAVDDADVDELSFVSFTVSFDSDDCDR